MKHPRNEHGPPSTTLETICYPPRHRSSPPATKHRDAGATLLYLSSPPPQFSRIEGAGAISRLSDSAELWKGELSSDGKSLPSPQVRGLLLCRSSHFFLKVEDTARMKEGSG